MKNLKNALMFSAVVSSLLLSSGTARAITYYDDNNGGMNAWAAATASNAAMYPFNFVDFGLPQNQITAPSHTGILSGDLGVNATVVSTQPGEVSLYGVTTSLSGGLSDWLDKVNAYPGPVFGPTTTTTFSFGVRMFAIGGNFNLNPEGELYSQGLLISIIGSDGAKQEVGTIDGYVYPAGFWGFILDTGDTSLFNFFKLEISSAGFGDGLIGPEIYSLTDLVYAVATPEPSTLLLIGAGFGGLLFWRRRR